MDQFLAKERPDTKLELSTPYYSLVFIEGMLRYIRVAEREVIRAIYAAVRDQNWNTIPGKLKLIEQRHSATGFYLHFESHHQEAEIDFYWQGILQGENRHLLYEMQGETRSSFKRNRIGFCVLHPMALAGQAAEIEHTDGSLTRGQFPGTISAHQPFKEIRSISHKTLEGFSIKVRMEGDSFEMEDQRNWTDASFKTYSTPLEKPFPVLLATGTKIHQRILLDVHGKIPEALPPQLASLSPGKSSKPLPLWGLGAGKSRLSDRALRFLKPLNLSHLRLELDLQDDYTELLKIKTSEANSLNCALELALSLSANAENELRELKEKLSAFNTPIKHLLVFHKAEKCTSAPWLRLCRQVFPGVLIAGGTDAFFAELNRERPDPANLDLLSYSLNPQVHAFDDASLIETLAAQAETVKTALSFSAGKPIIISPISLKMRSNPNATDGSKLSLKEQIDQRQQTLFGAAWLLGSLKYLLESDVYSLSYFETAGPLGVMNDEKVFPMYHILADLAEYSGAELLSLSSSHPLIFEGLVLRKDQRERIMLANFSKKAQTLMLKGFSGSYTGRLLDEQSLTSAQHEAENFRQQFPLHYAAKAALLELHLSPYAVLTLERQL